MNSDVGYFVYSALYDYIYNTSKSLGVWPKFTIFRKNNHMAIGLSFPVNMARYDENENMASKIIKEDIPIDLVLKIFKEVNSPDIKSLPLDSRTHYYVRYLDDIFHAEFGKLISRRW